jgi:chemotaxis protein MotB
MPRPKRGPISHERWLVSYADFITLLFAFFVVLYASAEVDKKRVGELTQSIRTAFQELGSFQNGMHPGNTAPIGVNVTAPRSVPVEHVKQRDLGPLKAGLQQVLANEISREEVSLRMDPEGLVISLRELGFFNSGSATLRPQARDAFRRLASILKSTGYPLRIEGHTDDVPISNSQFVSNWELSTSRATELVRLLVETYGYPPQSLAAAGYGEFHPVASNKTLKGRQSNRRVDVVVLSRTSDERSSASDRQWHLEGER